MELTVAGCRAGMPGDGQASSGYLVSSPTADPTTEPPHPASSRTTVLLDCGPGVATALSAITNPGCVDAVIISHLHLDHCYDLLPLGKSLLSTRVGYPTSGAAPQLEAAGEPVPLYVPAGARETLLRLAALFPVSTVPVLDRAFEVAFDVREYRPGDSFTVGAMTVELYPLRHAAPNCGVRLSCAGASLAYTGDTGPATDALVALARGADLLLAEATMEETDHGPHGHLSAGDAGHIAARAGVGELVLTHFPTADPAALHTRRDRAAAVFGGPVHLAAPFSRFPVPTTAKVAS